jgi:protein SCO1/2
MRWRLLSIVISGFLLGAIGGAAALLFTQGAPAPKVETAGKALIGGPFTLVDQSGRTVTDKDFRGRYMLVFFGFTHCPDVCPAELQVIAQALTDLGPKSSEVVPIFISLDPERDTPAVIGAYVKNFGDNFVGLTGSPEAVAAAAKAYRVAYSKFEYKDNSGKSDYSIDHSTIVYLMDKNGEYVAHFSYGTPAAEMAETLRRYL